jgi:hypothetical protein
VTITVEAVSPPSVPIAATVDAPGIPTATVSAFSGPAVESWGSRVDQSTPSASWNIPVPPSIGRVPSVSIYLTTGELVFADVTATDTNVYITFPSPYAGFVILT